MEYLDRGRDAFDNDVGNRTNVLDLPAHYPYSPERWRLFVDGARIYPEYETTVNDLAQYTHDTDRHALTPNAGETVVLRSAERPRYVVAYELVATFAMAINQELTAGDSWKVGLYDGTDGWYIEQDSTHAPDEADAVMERNGVEQYRREDQPLHIPSTEFGRFRLQTGWYNITRQDWERSYPQTDPPAQAKNNDKWTQQNQTITTGAMQNGRGPRYGNLPIYFEVTASADTTGLELSAGSAAQVNLGMTHPFLREKVGVFNDDITVTGAWEPLRAFRIDPDRHIVNVQIEDMDIGKYSVTDTVELLLMSADPSKVLDANGDPLVDADYATPPEWSPANNVLETSTAVDQFPDSTGTPQTTLQNPGGWQMGRTELFVGGGNQVTGTTDVTNGAKRPLYGQDVGVVLGRSVNTGTVSYQVQNTQDW